MGTPMALEIQYKDDRSGKQKGRLAINKPPKNRERSLV